MNTPHSNTKRIAKNTIFLYFRMLLAIIISLYTSRIVLEQLGENNFGIYSVVGGIVTMFSILSSSLSSSISRFLTFELGKENNEKVKQIFSTSVCILFGLSILIVLLLETVGLWFLNNKMNINPSRLYAANWVLQCSTLTFVINMLSIPYNAAIIANEKMNAFAYIGILEVLLKLGVALCLFIPLFDSLIVYSILLVATSAIIRIIYGIYCNRHFEECHFRLVFDKGLIKEMLGYSSWSFIGSSSAILKDQGVNIIINIFYGTALNAARGIANQVNTAVFGFAQNFMLAVNPQIIKSYAAEDKEYMFNLGFRSSRLSFYMLLCLSSPIIISMPYILGLWLTQVPPFTASFASLTLILGMSEAISIPLQYMSQASGRIKVYQLTVGGIQMLNFPVAYILLKRHISPDSVYYLAIIISQLCLGARLIILRKTIGFPVRRFLKGVYLKILIVLALCAIAAALISCMYGQFHIHPLIASGLMLVFSAIICYELGCSKGEKEFIAGKLAEMLKKFSPNKI